MTNKTPEEIAEALDDHFARKEVDPVELGRVLDKLVRENCKTDEEVKRFKLAVRPIFHNLRTLTRIV